MANIEEQPASDNSVVKTEATRQREEFFETLIAHTKQRQELTQEEQTAEQAKDLFLAQEYFNTPEFIATTKENCLLPFYIQSTFNEKEEKVLVLSVGARIATDTDKKPPFVQKLVYYHQFSQSPGDQTVSLESCNEIMDSFTG